jgi:gentisate 1,2-dioxygenase
MDTAAFYAKPETSAERKEFYRRLDARNAAPLWEVLGQIITPEPRPASVPVVWHYEEIRALLMESGDLITAEEAERRVLVLENPGLRGQSQITQSLYAGLQLVMPGEITPSHRHSAAALRFVIEGEGAYTAVNGERVTMRPGDFILTPSWTHHDHGNPSSQPVVWLDGLDIPIVNAFDTSFAEHPEEHHEDAQPTAGEDVNLLPLDSRPERLTIPVFSYPYSRSRQALEQMRATNALHPCHGIKMQFINPATGGYPMPTIGAFLQLMPSGFHGASYRSTDATVYCVAEGRGRSLVGENSFEWVEHDIFVVPSWCPVTHEARQESVLFSFSDRPAQKALGLWREDAKPA